MVCSSKGCVRSMSFPCGTLAAPAAAPPSVKAGVKPVVGSWRRRQPWKNTSANTNQYRLITSAPRMVRLIRPHVLNRYNTSPTHAAASTTADWSAEVSMRELELKIAGLGIILYSPPAVAHIAEGSDYLGEHFSRPEDVAR